MEWREEKNKLIKEFTFSDFDKAIDFINKVADIARKLDHHPEIRNIYSNVILLLSTHDTNNKVTEKDRNFAAEVDKLQN